ncbi:MAG: VWA domain-containing protein [Candidatus Cloacimonetes bacterium]|nr:VWA domain-containing protein [Candidatus Cloacimonadota bacterium]
MISLRKISISLAFLVLTLFVFADGFMVIPEPQYSPEPFPLEVVFHRVQVAIEDQMAETSIDQSFYNPTSTTLEGYYIFPVPSGAVLNDFTMFVDGRETPAELLGADKARKIYEDIVRQMKDPALLEYSDNGIFKVRIFPIEPHSEKRVKMSYSEILNRDNATLEYLYPLNTEKFSAKPLQDVSILVDLKTAAKLQTVYCPTHEVEIVRKDGSHALISYEDSNVKPDIDFKVYFTTGEEKVGMSLLSYREKKNEGFFFLSLSPVISKDEDEIIPKDIIFVLDVSGSMAGDKLKQAKQALIYCLENLNVQDRFDIIRFSTEAFALFRDLRPVGGESIEEAEAFIEELYPVGGTNIEDALLIALSYDREKDRPQIVVFITDGKPTIGELDEDKLLRKLDNSNKENLRIFTFGIGYEINTHLLDKITWQTKATRTYISPEEDIELKISAFYDKIQSPVLSAVTLRSSANVELYQFYPDILPDLFHGSNLTILGRYKGSGDSKFYLDGKLKGETVSYEYNVDLSQDNTRNEFIPPLWASRRIGHLLDLIRLYGESDEMVDEVTQLARTYGIVTPYTSYLILEDEDTRLVENHLNREFQTLSASGAMGGELRSDFQDEYEDMNLKSGSRSVEVSREFKNLNYALNLDQTRQGKERMMYENETGLEQNLTSQIRNIQGRAVYQTGDIWIDSELQNQESAAKKRIMFSSEEYFELFRNNRNAAQFLALGRNVRFYLDGTYYEIFD